MLNLKPAVLYRHLDSFAVRICFIIYFDPAFGHIGAVGNRILGQTVSKSRNVKFRQRVFVHIYRRRSTIAKIHFQGRIFYPLPACGISDHINSRHGNIDFSVRNGNFFPVGTDDALHLDEIPRHNQSVRIDDIVLGNVVSAEFSFQNCIFRYVYPKFFRFFPAACGKSKQCAQKQQEKTEYEISLFHHITLQQFIFDAICLTMPHFAARIILSHDAISVVFVSSITHSAVFPL